MIVPMKRLTLVALKSEEEQIIHALQAIAAVEIISREDNARSGLPAFVQAEERVQSLNNALNLAKPYVKKKPMLAAKPEATIEDLQEEVAPALQLSEELEKLSAQLMSVRTSLDKDHMLIETLEPWIGLNARMCDVKPTENVCFYTGLLKAQQIPRLDEISDCAVVEVLGGDTMRAVLITCHKDEAHRVDETLKGCDWTAYAFPDMPGTPKEAIAYLSERLDKGHADESALLEQIREKSQERDRIAAAADAAAIDRDREQARTAFGETETTFVLEGWARSDQEELVRAAIEDVTDVFWMEWNDPQEDEVPPSVVENKKLIEPYEAVTNLYSRPNPVNGIDATPYMAPFYFLLFGMMLSDTGYGLILTLGCWLFIKLIKPAGMTGSIARVILHAGISTIIWGFLIGTFFGLDFDVIFGTNNVFPLLIDPMANPINMLFLCFGLGLIHIVFGLILKIRQSFKHGDWQTAVFDNISWLLIIAGLLLFALVPAVSTVGIVMACLGAAMILFMKGRAKRNPAKRVASGLGELYQVTSYLSDILSYARLFALGIATGVIATVFNMLCGMLMGSPSVILNILGTLIAVVLLVALHLFNVAINTLGAFVHCARLQYIEFYGKFYEPGGREFKPLAYRTKHVRVSQPCK